eukprot:maker-scaffold_41-snap-gene-1.36-mRNA-1 protein AED:0.02 eAED:0.02 QI:615/1/0.5/1/0/0/2/0/94
MSDFHKFELLFLEVNACFTCCAFFVRFLRIKENESANEFLRLLNPPAPTPEGGGPRYDMCKWLLQVLNLVFVFKIAGIFDAFFGQSGFPFNRAE